MKSSSASSTGAARSSPLAQMTVMSAARGVGSHITWQVWSRVASFCIKATAVRKVAPKAFAFVELRLGVATSAFGAIGLGTRRVALRKESEVAAAAVVEAGVVATFFAVLLPLAFSIWREPHLAGVFVLVAANAVVACAGERGRVFAMRRGAFDGLARARAAARIIGGVFTSVAVLGGSTSSDPESDEKGSWGVYSVLIGNLVFSGFLTAGGEAAARIPPDRARIPWLSLPNVLRVLHWEDFCLWSVAVWEMAVKIVVENAESVVLDVTCVDSEKAAYRLAANVGSMLARLFSEAIEEQSFLVFSRLAPAFRDNREEVEGGRNNANDQQSRGACSVGEREEQRQECISFLYMALKSALLVALLIAMVGPSFSYSFLRLLYGTRWAENTSAPRLLSLYFIYLVFMAANGVTDALVAATASASRLRQRSAFSVVFSALYVVSLYIVGSRYSVDGIIAVNCANMAVRTVYSAVYYAQLTSLPMSSLVIRGAPAPSVFAVLTLAKLLCMASERRFLQHYPDNTLSFLVVLGFHAVSGVVGVLMFLTSVYLFEGEFCSYIRGLLGSGGPQSRGASVTDAGRDHEHKD